MQSLKLLVVEDKQIIRERLKKTFQEPPQHFRDLYKVGHFEVDTAEHAKEAEEKLALAKDKAPYDLMLLDLGLPRDSQDPMENDAVGLGILETLGKWESEQPHQPAVLATVVASAYHNRLIDLLRTQRVSDFVQKPWDAENEFPFRAIVLAMARSQMRLWEQQLAGRDKFWMPIQIRVQETNLQTQALINGVRAAAIEHAKLRQVLEDEHQLNWELDENLEVCRQWERTRKAIAKIASDYGRVLGPESPVATNGQTPRPKLKDILDSVCLDVRCGLLGKRIPFTIGQLPDKLFVNWSPFIKDIIEEIITGSITDSPHGSPISLEFQDNKIILSDQAKILTPENLKAIAQAGMAKTEVGSRVWGLALARYLALDIGLGLDAVSDTNGNTITLDLYRRLSHE